MGKHFSRDPGYPAAMAGGALADLVSARRERWWRRTRLGLLLTGVGLLVGWIPIVAAVAALFLALGSTFLFLGAKAAGRRHEVLVVLSYLVMTVGGVLVAMFVGSFLLQAYDGAKRGLPLASLEEPALLMIWWTLPASVAIAAGFVLQVLLLLPRRQQRLMILLSLVLVVTATSATVLGAAEVASLGPQPVTASTIFDFLIRLSLYRMLEAPAYIGLAVLYFLGYWDAGLTLPRESVPAPSPAEGQSGG